MGKLLTIGPRCDPAQLHQLITGLNTLYFLLVGFFLVLDYSANLAVLVMEGFGFVFVLLVGLLLFVWMIKWDTLFREQVLDYVSIGNLGYYVVMHVVVHAFLFGFAARFQYSTSTLLSLGNIYMVVFGFAFTLAVFGYFTADDKLIYKDDTLPVTVKKSVNTHIPGTHAAAGAGRVQ